MMFYEKPKEDRVIDFVKNKRFLDTNPFGEEYEDEECEVCTMYDHTPRFEC